MRHVLAGCRCRAVVQLAGLDLGQAPMHRGRFHHHQLGRVGNLECVCDAIPGLMTAPRGNGHNHYDRQHKDQHDDLDKRYAALCIHEQDSLAQGKTEQIALPSVTVMQAVAYSSG